MIKISTIALISMILFSSCNGKLRNRIIELEEENQNLKEQLNKEKERGLFEVITRGLEHSKDEIPIEEPKTLREAIQELENEIISSNVQEILVKKNIILEALNELQNSIETTKDYMIQLNGGYNEDGWINNSKETSVVNEVMLQQGKGKQIHTRLIKCIEIINSQLELTESQKNKLPIRYNLAITRKEQSWEEFNFKNMPIGATIPIFTKLRNDCNSSKLYVLNLLKNQIK